MDKDQQWWQTATPDIISKMIMDGADINEKGNAGYTPLMKTITMDEKT